MIRDWKKSWQVEAQASDKAQIRSLNGGTAWDTFVSLVGMYAARCVGWQVSKLVWLFVDVVRN